jgi:hypothetical protein
MKVPMDQIEDFDPEDPDIEFRKNRWKYWTILRKIREEYIIDKGMFDTDSFEKYVERNYGIRINISDEKITDKFDIIDKKLYTFFILKWAE